jgi:uncharacterized Zn-binding protein involved in type VI secretion
MEQGLIVLGDKTNHGGTVISAAPTTYTHEKRVARLGDMVSCPKCKGVFPIAQGDRSFNVEGAPAAYHGCKTACGATVLSSQGVTTTDPSGGPRFGGATTSGRKDFGAIGSGLLAGYQEEPLDDNLRFRGRFQVLDAVSGEPITSKSIRLRSTGGQYLTGTTDAEGYTEWVERDAAEALAFDLIEEV